MAAVNTALHSLAELTATARDALPPPSADFAAQAAAPRESDRGQIDGGPRYDDLIADIVAFFRSDRGVAEGSAAM